MKKIFKLLIAGVVIVIVIGAVIYMVQMGQKDSESLKNRLDEINPFNRNQSKSSKQEKKSADILKKKRRKKPEKTAEEKIASNGVEVNTEIVSDEIEVVEKTVEEELAEGKTLFAYLLPMTKEAVAEKAKMGKKLDLQYIYQCWEDSLGDDCKLLYTKFKSLSNETEKVSDKIDDAGIKDVFSQWMDYLKTLGLSEYNDESMDENGNVTISIKNRKFYVNGRKFSDGSVCEVKRKPWIYNDDIYFDGILCDVVEKAEAAENDENKADTDSSEDKL